MLLYGLSAHHSILVNAPRPLPFCFCSQGLYDLGRFNNDEEEEEFSIPPLPTPPSMKDAQEEDSQENVRGVVLPAARNVRVKSAEFIKSSVNVQGCPPASFPEFAVIGRSNVGKSSLINMLTGRNSLAMVSKTPGKTKLINHFLINGAWYLVDLPGYG
jgi:hypothetical protein